MAVFLEVEVRVVVVVELKLLVGYALAIMGELSDTRALWKMAHEYVCGLFVIEFSD